MKERYFIKNKKNNNKRKRPTYLSYHIQTILKIAKNANKTTFATKLNYNNNLFCVMMDIRFLIVNLYSLFLH